MNNKKYYNKLTKMKNKQKNLIIKIYRQISKNIMTTNKVKLKG